MEKKKELKVWDILYILWKTYIDSYSTVYRGKVMKIENITKYWYDEDWFTTEYEEKIYLIWVDCKKKCMFYIDEDWEFYKAHCATEEEDSDCALRHKGNLVFINKDEAKEYMMKSREKFYSDKIKHYTKEIEEWKKIIKNVKSDTDRIFTNL